MSYTYNYVTEGSITNCFPVDTDTEMWVDNSNGVSISELIQKAKEKWPDVEFDNITINSEYHHQYCIYYDMFDCSDYVNYLVLTVEK